MQVPQSTGEDPTATMPAEAIRFETVRDTEGLLALGDEWRRLWHAAVGDFYMPGFDVTLESWKRFSEPGGEELCIVVGRAGGRVVLICPVKIGRHMIWRTASWLSRDPLDYGEILVEPSPQREAWVEAALEHLRCEADCHLLILESVRDDAAAGPVLAKRFPVRLPESAAPFLDLRGYKDGDDFEARLPKRMRQSMRRRARRLEELGTPAFRFERDPEALEESLRWVVDRKREWIEHQDVSDATGISDEHVDMLVWTFRNPKRSEVPLLSRLTLDGKLIAVDIGFIVGKCYYADSSTFDLKLGKYSPGTLLLRESIKWSIENGIETFDLGRGADDYKYDWTATEMALSRFIYPLNLSGRLYAALRSSRLYAMARGGGHD